MVDINQTVKTDGKVTSTKLNDALLKMADWWAKMGAIIKNPEPNTVLFEADPGDVETPSYRFKEEPTTGIYGDPDTGKLRYAWVGTDRGDLSSGHHFTRVSRATSQSINNTTWTYMIFENVSPVDRGILWDSGNPTDIGVSEPGLYLISFCATFNPFGSSPHRCIATISVDGTTADRGWCANYATTSVYNTLNCTDTIWLEPGNVLRGYIYQSSGGALGTYPNANLNHMSVKKIG